MTGAPVMQLEIRNAVERDQILYNGLGLLFGALIAVIILKEPLRPARIVAALMIVCGLMLLRAA